MIDEELNTIDQNVCQNQAKTIVSKVGTAYLRKGNGNPRNPNITLLFLKIHWQLNLALHGLIHSASS
jgi:hypothetical protein